MSGNPSDGCASGCGGCLLTGLALLTGSALFLAGPTGWVLGMVIVVVLLALGRDRSKHRTASLLRQSRPSVGSGVLAAGWIDPGPPLPPDPATEVAAILGRDSDQELDQLLAEARRAVDEAV